LIFKTFTKNYSSRDTVPLIFVLLQANAAAYLQHLCYMDDPVKAKTRQLGGIPPLVALLTHEIPDIHKNACGALR
jgi:hypothetical protein